MYWDFLRGFIKNPVGVSTVAPSSHFLARQIISNTDISSASVIVEYGPGTGAFTPEILRKKNPDAFYFVVENNPDMAEAFRKRFPEVLLVENSVVNLPSILDDFGRAEVDCIISGLPWAMFGHEFQDRLLGATMEVLKQGGKFATYAYPQGLLSPTGQRFKRKLKHHFSAVSTSPIVWRNLPPAFVYRCVK